jgi:hypothetical protein
MKIRTYYWNDRIIGSARLRLRAALRRPTGLHFATGNAGDILVRDLVEYLYGAPALHTTKTGGRFVPIGSVGHKLLDGDVVSGIGVKTDPIPSARATRLHLVGLRGPITLERFARAGHDVSTVRFLLDPGLLVRDICRLDERAPVEAEAGRIAFIPHYRERAQYSGRIPPHLCFVDIDAPPTTIAEEILRSETVYASSLHGVVFAHALGRPCVLVAPDDREDLLKYEDYYLSVGLPWKRPPSDLDEALRQPAPTSPADVRFSSTDFDFPTIDELRDAGVVID